VKAVLHRDHRGQFAGLSQLGSGDPAEPEVSDETAMVQFGERGESFGEGSVVREEQAVTADAQIDQVEATLGEPGEVLLDLVAEFGRLGGGVPASPFVSDHADLGSDHEIVGIGVQRLADEIVGHMRAVEVAGVDVGDTKLD
jgi:hypothetical protein